MTRAPWSAAQRIAAASASIGMRPSAVTILATTRSTGRPSPAMPTALFAEAAIIPAMNVPWP